MNKLELDMGEEMATRGYRSYKKVRRQEVVGATVKYLTFFFIVASAYFIIGTIYNLTSLLWVG